MPFDPNIPQANTEIDAVQMRGQLNGLKALIDAVQSIVAAVVDGVITLNPGDPASALASIIGNTLHLSFGIPRGNDGAPGMTGADGATGPQGQQGPPFGQAIVDNVITLAPGTPAYVTVTFDGSNVHFTFGIPAGAQGPAGADGAPGEVTNASLAAAISGTSNNTNAVATLDTPFADPDAESMRVRFNELVLALRRA